MRNLNHGDRGSDVRRIQRATNRRLRARSAGRLACKEDGVWGPATRKAFVAACYLLGMAGKELEGVKSPHNVGPNEQRFVLNPGKRDRGELYRGKLRVKKRRAAIKKAEARAARASSKRKRVVRLAKQAAANYRRNPRAYHYLAGGIANTAFLRPTPRNWRSDCSQFVASIYKEAGLPSPAAPLDHKWASTFSMVKSPRMRVTRHPEPGDLGMYGSRSAPHHVELYIGEPGCKFIGHGSPPIDSLTPGNPDYYITFDFLN